MGKGLENDKRTLDAQNAVRVAGGFLHAPCGKTYPYWDSENGGARVNPEATYLNHHCPALTVSRVSNPQWYAMHRLLSEWAERAVRP